MSSKTYRWVPRNEDKPHRCPECHSVAPWRTGQDTYGPRTTAYCADCRVRWKYGNRAPRLRIARRIRQRAAQHYPHLVAGEILRAAENRPDAS